MRFNEITDSAEDITQHLPKTGVKWRRMRKNEEGDSQVATVLKNGMVFMFYYMPGDRDTGWAESMLEKGENINDIYWGDSGTDDMDDALRRFETWRDTDGQQVGYEIEDEEPIWGPGDEDDIDDDEDLMAGRGQRPVAQQRIRARKLR